MNHIQATVETAFATFILMRNDADHSILRYFPRNEPPPPLFTPTRFLR